MTIVASQPVHAQSSIDLSAFCIAPPAPAPYVAWADRPRLTDAERAEVNATRNEALWDAEHDTGTDGDGLTPAELGRWVRQAEAEAIAAVMDARDRVEAQGPRPTAEDRVEVSAVAQAEWMGHRVGSEGIAAKPTADHSPEEREAFRRGHAAGFQEFEDEEFDRWVTRQEQEHEAEWSHAEAVEAAGIFAARAAV